MCRLLLQSGGKERLSPLVGIAGAGANASAGAFDVKMVVSFNLVNGGYVCTRASCSPEGWECGNGKARLRQAATNVLYECIYIYLYLRSLVNAKVKPK